MMQTSLLDAVTVGAENAQFSVIWMHGLGADGHDFEPLVPALQFRQKQHTRFIFPHAPSRPVTVNMGYVMPAWFDIFALEIQARQDEQGIRQAEKWITALIEREHQRGVPYKRIVLAGFSQGGAVALHTGLRFPQRLAGILALSTYLPLAESLTHEAQPANRDIPVFMAHGQEDPVLPLPFAEASRQMLLQSGYMLSWHVYPMAHGICPEEIIDIDDWLQSVYS